MKETEPKKTGKTRQVSNSVGEGLRGIFTGNVLTKRFWRKHIGLIIWSVILIIIYMNNRMVCENDLKRIDSLRKTLVNEKYISMITEAELLSNSRIGKIKELVTEQGLTLLEEDKPPFIIRINKE